MRNPNGYGSVVKLSGKRRRPYMVRKTAGYNDKGYPIYQIIGYTETRKEGMILLSKYNERPYDITSKDLTLQKLFDLYIDSKKDKITNNAIVSLKSVFKWAKDISKKPYIDIRAEDMQDVIDACPRSYSMKNHLRNLFVNLDKFAIAHDFIDKGYAEYTESARNETKDRHPFAEAEIDVLWDIWEEIARGEFVAADKIGICSCFALILIYSGWRANEFLGMKKADIDFEQMTMKGGMKTDAGRNRIVPIHPRILPVLKHVCDLYDSDTIYPDGYSCFSYMWRVYFPKTGMKHCAHECRHTFRSRLDSAGAKKVCIDIMMGHKSADVGERVYTHKTIEELRDAILLLK